MSRRVRRGIAAGRSVRRTRRARGRVCRSASASWRVRWRASTRGCIRRGLSACRCV
jgi:hypothetical protein